jgi:hypothetical protein
MPSAHRRYAEWTIERIGIDAAAIGPCTATLAALILESRPHPEQGYRACIGILRLARPSGWKRLATAGLRSAPAPTARSNRSSSTASIGVPLGRQRNASCC